MNRLRQHAAVKLAATHAQRRAERLVIIPERLRVTRIEKMYYSGQGMSDRARQIIRKASKLRMVCFVQDEPNGDTLFTFAMPSQKQEVR